MLIIYFNLDYQKDSVFVIKWKTHEIDFIVNWYWRMQVWGGHIKFLLFSMAASHYKRIIRCVMCITMTSIDNITSSLFQFYCCKSNSTHNIFIFTVVNQILLTKLQGRCSAGLARRVAHIEMEERAEIELKEYCWSKWGSVMLSQKLYSRYF
jgi:hypothetical protein